MSFCINYAHGFHAIGEKQSPLWYAPQCLCTTIRNTHYIDVTMSISNHQPHDCLLSRFFRRRSKKTPKLRVTGLCAGNSPVTGEFPTQMASNAENVSIWWRHHVNSIIGSVAHTPPMFPLLYISWWVDVNIDLPQAIPMSSLCCLFHVICKNKHWSANWTELNLEKNNHIMTHENALHGAVCYPQIQAPMRINAWFSRTKLDSYR